MEKPNKIDFKKAFKDLYLPKRTPMLIEVPPIPFLMIDGKGNPNEEGGAYQQAMQIIYGVTFTIKMSKKGSKQLDGYYDYVLPPLEGLWEMEDTQELDYTHKDDMVWTSMIRLPEYVNQEVFAWACEEVKKKHPDMDISKARLETYAEGLCAQIMHIGPYDAEPETLERLHAYIDEQGYAVDIGSLTISNHIRRHHEIYLGDPRKCKPENLKTVLRIPIKKKA